MGPRDTGCANVCQDVDAYFCLFSFLRFFFFFLMWAIFKVFNEFVTIIILFSVLVFWLPGM